jgi:hypothetical protein
MVHEPAEPNEQHAEPGADSLPHMAPSREESSSWWERFRGWLWGYDDGSCFFVGDRPRKSVEQPPTGPPLLSILQLFELRIR